MPPFAKEIVFIMKVSRQRIEQCVQTVAQNSFKKYFATLFMAHQNIISEDLGHDEASVVIRQWFSSIIHDNGRNLVFEKFFVRKHVLEKKSIECQKWWVQTGNTSQNGTFPQRKWEDPLTRIRVFLLKKSTKKRQLCCNKSHARRHEAQHTRKALIKKPVYNWTPSSISFSGQKCCKRQNKFGRLIMVLCSLVSKTVN